MNSTQPVYSSSAPAAIASVALFLSVLALLGHWLQLPILTSLLSGQQQMVISTAAGILAASIALVLQSVLPPPIARNLTSTIALILMVVGVVALLEFKLDYSWLDFNALHQHNPKQNPGRMAFNTAICFLLLGCAMMISNFYKLKKLRYLSLACLILLSVFSALGVISFVANFEFLSNFGHSNRMALPTSLSFLALALATSVAQKLIRYPRQDIDQEITGTKFYMTLELLLVLIVMIVALLSFASSQQRVEILMAKQLEKIASQSRNYFNTVFMLNHEAAILHADKTEFSEVLQKYQHNAKLNLAGYLAGINMLNQRFSMLALENPQHEVIFQGGKAAVPQLSLPVFSNPPSDLLWSDGYVLRTSVPKYNDSGDLLGYVVLEQRMDEVTHFHADAISKPGTSDLALCGLQNDYQVCFPFRWSQKPIKNYAYLDGKALPVTRAVMGFTETSVTKDFRRERVMASIGPLGQTGLGMAVKIDLHELYEPIRHQFYASLPFFILLTILSLGLMRFKLKPLIDEIERSRHKLGKLALQDPLTHLANRTLFYDRLEFAISKLARKNKKVGLIYLDIDYFKIINDTYGHITGDQVLIWFAKLLKESVRHSDTVARIGGDEFSIIIEEIEDTADAERVVRQILEKLNHSLAILEKGPVKTVTASLGIAITSNKATLSESLIDAADQALYHAKQSGRNTFKLVEI